MMDNKKLDYFYNLLSPEILSFDCGKLCAPLNDGIPKCCDPRNMVPLLYWDEIRWDKQKGHNTWQTLSAKDIIKHDLSLHVDPELEVYAHCNCLDNCRRKSRSLICRTFPFLPYFEGEQLVGLTYNYFQEGFCPLIGDDQLVINPEYLKNATQFWSEFLELFPEEKELYIFESKDRKQLLAKQNRSIKIFQNQP